MKENSPGARLDAAWLRLMRAVAPLTQMLAVQRVKRRAALEAVAAARRELDAMERILNGERK